MPRGVLVGGIANGAHEFFVGAGCPQTVLSGAIQPEADAALLDEVDKARRSF
jgi:hypothetical protein